VAKGPAHDGAWALAALQAGSLWSLAPGQGHGITIAVVDTGIDGKHPDLAGVVSYPGHVRQRDESVGSHGTEIAGLIAGQGPQAAGKGGAQGLAPQAKLIDIPVTSDPRKVTAAQIATGIMRAVQAQAQVINVSLGLHVPVGSRDYQRIQGAVDYALGQGRLVVASVGTDGLGKFYPADINGVIAVAASGQHGAPTSPLNRDGQLAVYAPGDDLYSTNKQGGYTGDLSGNDFAAAYVSAAAAVIWSQYGGTAGQVAQAIVGEVAPTSPPSSLGHGILDPVLVLQQPLPAASSPASGPDGTSKSAGSGPSKGDVGSPQAGGSSPASHGKLTALLFVVAVVVGAALFFGLGMYFTGRRRPPRPPAPGSGIDARMPFDWDLEPQ
jgi:subtilisin family serine protease